MAAGEQGAAMVIALLAVALILLLGAAYAGQGGQDGRLAQAEYHGERAFQAAEAGIARALACLAAYPNDPLDDCWSEQDRESWQPVAAGATGQWVRLTWFEMFAGMGPDGLFLIEAEGRAGPGSDLSRAPARRRLTMEVERQAGGALQVLSYTEVVP